MYSALFLSLLSAIAVAAQKGDWTAAYDSATGALAQLTNDQKVGIVTGTGWMNGNCVGNTGDAPNIGFRSLCLQDGPLGVRTATGVTAFPAGIHAASTWDVELIRQRGLAMGEEFRALGVNVQLGPVAGAIGKIPAAGRNWEAFGPDPYFTGIAMQETIIGIQEAGVQACAKHYILNEQELNRGSMSSSVDDRAMHELYLWPFADSVKANVASIMCSYNRIDGVYACENDAVLNSLLKDELSFPGYVLTDWGAQHSNENSANAGLDMAMPGDGMGDGNYYWGPNLLNAVDSGSVPQERLDDMVKRILASWYYIGQDKDYPEVGFDNWQPGTGKDVQGDHATVARAIARDGIVLLKNVDNALPLNKPATLAIIGSDAFPNPDGPNACVDRGCNVGTLAMGWGSGTVEFPYLIAPHDAIKERADADGTVLTTSPNDETASATAAATAAETAIVFINADSGEEYITVEGNAGDRNDLNAWHNGNELVQAVAEVNAKTIVVIHSVGQILLESFIELENVVAVVWAGLPGQESGNGLVDILYGDTAPNGKLPYTIGKTAEDHGTAIVPGDDSYPEGLFIDYRHYDKNEIEPRFEFGFGLSYTTFDYTELTATYTDKSPGEGSPAPGGPTSLYDEVATVTATITNNGTVTGAEVAQLYIGLPESAPETPVRQLRGFQKVSLEAGASAPVSFSLRRKDLSYWDTEAQAWVTPTGEFKVYVGASSRDIRLTGTM
ncbi:hypothetical protein AJ79_02338 [Helicocarpus griseus UAMH5409]|uniref:Probable beta-glucosidase L n=1 Tax=Helicocarpus griseus UAMH5409 TaxID=1447875 RepID=A0A2B7Y254_9EURO|nr:hypothetical protein AJ79_02338 [Helicocarpus griseus UAMH5409]